MNTSSKTVRLLIHVSMRVCVIFFFLRSAGSSPKSLQQPPLRSGGGLGSKGYDNKQELSLVSRLLCIHRENGLFHIQI